jgi:hypothetical protein
MRAIIRWLAANEITKARKQGFMDGFQACAAALRRTAYKEGPGREQARDALYAAADGIKDAIATVRQ